GPVPRIADVRPDAPPGLADAITRALSKETADRFRDLAEFALAIAPYGGPGAAASAAVVELALRPPRSGGEDDTVALPGSQRDEIDPPTVSLDAGHEREVNPFVDSEREKTRKMKPLPSKRPSAPPAPLSTPTRNQTRLAVLLSGTAIMIAIALALYG